MAEEGVKAVDKNGDEMVMGARNDEREGLLTSFGRC
jgi:hypothetical protein